MSRAKKMRSPIGVLDWGIGGLSVYNELQRQSKSASYVYFSDSGFTPYGKTRKRELVRRLNKVLSFLRQKNVSTVIIACNAASTVLDQVKKENSDLKLFGMLEAGQESILKSKKKSILVLGGKRTISSQYFQKAFARSNVKLQALVAQPLSALIEAGQQKTKVFELEVLKLKAKAARNPEMILLACTHYPAAEKTFKKCFPDSLIVDPAIELVNSFLKKSKSKSTSQFFTTGSPAQSKLSAKKAFDLKIKKFHKIKL